MRDELHSLREFHSLARSIAKNSKGEVLLTALKRGFAEAMKKGANKKAVIFTESTRTQSYLRDILEKTEYAGKIVLFNGSNTDPKARQIYKDWARKHAGTDRVTGSPSADMRAALVDCRYILARHPTQTLTSPHEHARKTRPVFRQHHRRAEGQTQISFPGSHHRRRQD
jgi:hypothetical protein